MIVKMHTIELKYDAAGTEEDLKMLQKYEPGVSWYTKKDLEVPTWERSGEAYEGWTDDLFEAKAQHDYDEYMAQPVRKFKTPYHFESFKYVDLAAFIKEERFIPFIVTAEHLLEVSGVSQNSALIKVSDVVQALYDLVKKSGN